MIVLFLSASVLASTLDPTEQEIECAIIRSAKYLIAEQNLELCWQDLNQLPLDCLVHYFDDLSRADAEYKLCIDPVQGS